MYYYLIIHNTIIGGIFLPFLFSLSLAIFLALLSLIPHFSAHVDEDDDDDDGAADKHQRKKKEKLLI
jgi:hypothetical protein